MTTTSGMVLNAGAVLTKFGCKVPYRSGLTKGTKIWIHYKKDGSILSVEERKEEHCWMGVEWGGEDSGTVL